MKILVINAGSSSYKLALYAVENPIISQPQNAIWQLSFEWKDQPQSALESKLKESLQQAIEIKAISSLKEIAMVGHRIVHGGNRFKQSVVISPVVKKAITDLIPLAPLHNPRGLQGIEILEKILPHAKQIAVFDTTFFNTLSEAASTYPGPYEWKEQGIKRFGFHGISHHYCTERVAYFLQKKLNTLKIVSCHLGNGSSLAAILNGKCIDTTMGFTPLEGLMMGTRCGSIDPGILLFLEQSSKVDSDTLFYTLNYESGLKGISGISEDMRDILRERRQGNERAILAFDMYIHILKRFIGAMIAVLGGIDVLIFTGGIGENSPEVRAAVCKYFACFNLHLDLTKNTESKGDAMISTKDSAYILQIKTQEDWTIACDCFSARI